MEAIAGHLGGDKVWFEQDDGWRQNLWAGVSQSLPCIAPSLHRSAPSLPRVVYLIFQSVSVLTAHHDVTLFSYLVADQP